MFLGRITAIPIVLRAPADRTPPFSCWNRCARPVAGSLHQPCQERRREVCPLMRSKTPHNPTSSLAALFFLLTTPLAGWSQQSTPTAAEVLSLDQAINIALQNNLPLK